MLELSFSYAIVAEYFPTELVGRASAALNLFHIGGAFVVQCVTGIVVQLWAPTDGHYPEIAYHTAFALNIGLQVAAAIWFAQAWILACLGTVGSSICGVRAAFSALPNTRQVAMSCQMQQ